MKLKIAGLVVISVIIIFILFYMKDINLISEVKGHDYSIRYIIEPSMKDYKRLEEIIDSEGNVITIKYLIDDSQSEIHEGRYLQEELDDFIIYSIRQGMTEMSSNMDSVDIMDGSNIYFEIIIGEARYYFGGYMANYVNPKFEKINSKFLELIKK